LQKVAGQGSHGYSLARPHQKRSFGHHGLSGL
jgi:hypothetical protein